MKQIAESILLLVFSCILLIVFTAKLLFGQSENQTCNCPVGIYSSTKADTVFRLTNNKSIVLCGSRDTTIEKGRTYFSEFVLAACGEKRIIKFWDAVLACRLKVVRDTLMVETMADLPVGKNMKPEWTVWTIEPIYFKKGDVKHDFRVNRSIARYSRREIASALRQYEQAPKEISDANMEIADELFMCAISGSQQARTCLTDFKQHFGVLDGVNAEWYDDVMRRLKLWDTNIPSYDHF